MKIEEWLNYMFSKDAIKFYLQSDLLSDVIWIFCYLVSYCLLLQISLFCHLISKLLWLPNKLFWNNLNHRQIK